MLVAENVDFFHGGSSLEEAGCSEAHHFTTCTLCLETTSNPGGSECTSSGGGDWLGGGGSDRFGTSSWPAFRSGSDWSGVDAGVLCRWSDDGIGDGAGIAFGVVSVLAFLAVFQTLKASYPGMLLNSSPKVYVYLCPVGFTRGAERSNGTLAKRLTTRYA
jgi:hypothetical protein